MNGDLSETARWLFIGFIGSDDNWLDKPFNRCSFWGVGNEESSNASAKIMKPSSFPYHVSQCESKIMDTHHPSLILFVACMWATVMFLREMSSEFILVGISTQRHFKEIDTFFIFSDQTPTFCETPSVDFVSGIVSQNCWID